LRQIIIRVQAIFGFKIIDDKSAQKSVDISTYLNETDQKILELPKEYRNLFSANTSIKTDLYVNTSGNVIKTGKAFELWKGGLSSSMAIVGEKGSGKSTLINLCNLDVFKDENILDIDIDQSVWKIEQILSLFGKHFGVEELNRPEKLINYLNEKDEKIVVQLEGIQNLYLRNINGFEALEALWLIMSETKSNVFWVATCSRYAWDFLNKVQGVETHFTHVLYTDNLNSDDIESIIMKRHEESGYKLKFEANESIRKSRAYKKRLANPDDIQEYLKNLYFEKLSNLADGNTSVAIILWLRSIKEVKNKTLVILPFQPVDIEGLEILDSETLFTLSAIVLHDTLKVAELCRVLSLSLTSSRVLLTRLKSRGILKEKEGTYLLNQLVYRQAIKLLKKRNIIH
tara:strand:- start:5993 stop:7192 length:1200 start_codon:yes stop_codon:yes gene_type:complete